ncbi:MAG: hypothetical protein EYC69_06095 [Bacteroidetes bacterium]|nr:MAG: hypothetical protein EYC69_06095 [Bacteroidota bacterium]
MDLKIVHERCKEEFLKLFPNGIESIACDIWDVCVADARETENCIGENFNQFFHLIKDCWFNENNNMVSMDRFYAETYLMWLYRIVAQVNTIFYSLEMSDKTKLWGLKTFQEIRLWANFLKHPKEFLHSYWHQWIWEGDDLVNRDTSTIIDKKYLEKHYSSDKDERPITLTKNMEVVIEYPNLIRLTTGLVEDFKSFKSFLCSDPQAIEKLREHGNLSYKISEEDAEAPRP